MNAGWLMEWSFAIFLVLMEIMILYLVWTGASSDRGINLAKVISEKDGSASLSRFQALLFTFVVVAVFAMQAFSPETVVAGGNTMTTWTWPQIDDNTLYLLAGSGGTYLTSKVIQKTAEANEGGGAAGASAPGGRFLR